MQTQASPGSITLISAIAGTLTGFYKAMNAGSSILHTVLLTAISAAVSCIISFYLQQWLKKR
ncbi:hypothetical protein FC093_13920 [Ilyomonas limi]|uniref:Uncharacterized protein n=1 Tax=Ilyomonas limi TaxID=2575867 RepID=A0A4U3KZY4_9BACT|nr:hypothetical protein [Ilyomonas limi]TKK67394.1 hypothetical protein FC093_13920 [Ilyomonas limi]